MRYAIFGDIHGNLEALEAVLAEVDRLGADACFCMGDIVGYGADPEPCMMRVRQLGCLAIVGNHDHAAIGALDITYFNQYARRAAIWTSDNLSEESRAFLRGLSFVEHAPEFAIVHGSLNAPEAFNYVQTLRDAEINFRMMDKPLLFLGHSHQPVAFFDTDPMTYALEEHIAVDPESKTIVNVGSVGQPRDEDPRAAFALYDTEAQEVVIHRVEYDIDRAAGKIMDARLPQALAMRLSLGK